ncbi:ribosomal RNA adenine dimethylase [Candidatus Woesearchaeota archaeon]|nr:ribosomal RNA adenine dimethylase [Candidatus Woesearchaeota archaeon]
MGKTGKTVYIREFLRNYRSIGTIAPSSRFLIKKMLKPIDFSSASLIVEFGAGEGCITKEILKKMRPDAVLMSFEKNENIFGILSGIKDKRLIAIKDGAEKLPSYLISFNLPKPDCIVSGLPLASLPKDAGKNIIDAVKTSLPPQGKYIQYQYSLKSFRGFREKFSSVKLDFTLWNIPPAFVYTCRV